MYFTCQGLALAVEEQENWVLLGAMQQLTQLGSNEAPLLAQSGSSSFDVSHSRRSVENVRRGPRLRGIRSREEQKANALGTFEGVFMPCVSSILGAVLFVRMSWAVGEAGFLGVMTMLAAGTFVNVMTALSLAAISTNGTMKGGGAYFMISRSIGPELGVSVGVIFMLSLAVSSAFSLIAFAETFVNSFICDAESENCTTFVENRSLLIALIASLTLLVMAIAAATIGQAVGKFTNLTTCVMMVSIILGIISLLFVPGEESNPSGARFLENLWFDFTTEPSSDPSASSSVAEDQTFLSVFVIIFPAFTGITAGAGSSGNLRDPGASIGPGTLRAIGFTAILYALLMFVFALTLPRATLKENRSIFKDECVAPWFIVVGILGCSLTAAVGNLQSAARLLQSLARDGLLPSLKPFTQGSSRDDEPQVALLLCWLIAQICVLYGRLDALASLVTDSFLLVYIFLNLAVFALRIASAPNFRPRFAYFSWHTALAGALSALFIMFITSPQQGMLAFCMLAGLAYYVHVTAPVTPWGDVSQALIYHQVRKYLLRLDLRRSHPKFWRPSVLFLPRYPRGQLALLDFCNNLKKGGLYVVGNVLISQFHKKGVMTEMTDYAIACDRLKKLWADLLHVTGTKAFHEAVLAPTFVQGMRSLLMTSGLGGLRPNTVCLQFYEPRSNQGEGASSSMRASSSLPSSSSMTTPQEAPFLSRPNNYREGESQNLGNAIFDNSLQLPNEYVVDREPRQSQPSMNMNTAAEYTSFGSAKASSLLLNINHLISTFAEDAIEESEEEAQMSFCETLADVLVLEKNLLVARHFELLNKDLIMDYKRRRRAAAARQSKRFFFRSPASFRFRFRVSGSVRGREEDAGSGDAYERNLEGEDDYSDRTYDHTRSDSDDQESIATHLTDMDSTRHFRQDSSINNDLEYNRNIEIGGEDQFFESELDKFTTIDLWSTDESDWNDPSGSLALQMQLAFGLHRCDIWEDHTKLRVIAACPSVTDSRGSEEARQSALKAYETLRRLLRAIRVEADILVLPAVGAALFEEHTIPGEDGRPPKHLRRDRRSQPLTQLEHCAELNAMVQEHSGDKACVVFLPLPRPPSHSRINPRSATRYVENLQVLTQCLPPVILACPGSNIEPIVTTEL